MGGRKAGLQAELRDRRWTQRRVERELALQAAEDAARLPYEVLQGVDPIEDLGLAEAQYQGWSNGSDPNREAHA